MRLLVGLGNPGGRYARNRHNIGFMAVDAIARAHGFAPWRAKFQGQLTEGRLGADKALLLKPETFMNLSGDSVRAAATFYKLTPADIIVFHDELDLGPGKVRVKSGGGHAGHNGLRSIQAHMGPEFRRVRLGIGHPGHKDLVTPHVLGDFAKADEDWLGDLLDGIADGAPALADGNDAEFLNRIGLRRAPAPAPRRAPAGPAAGAPAGVPAAEPPATDDRGMLQRLADRFR